MMKKILVVLLVMLPALGWAQGASADAAKWMKARDYLSCQLALEAIRSKAGSDSLVRGRFMRIEPTLEAVKIDAPPNAVALDGTLHDFARVRQMVVDPISKIDVHAYISMKEGASRLVDTAFAIVARAYTIPMAYKVAMGSVVVNYLPDGAVAARTGDTGAKAAGDGAGSGGAGATAANKKPVIALGGQPDGVAAAARGRGFDFWVLLPLVLLGVLCVVLRRKYLEIKDELKARKVEMRSFNENYFGSGRGEGAKPKSSDRAALERAIVELNEAIGKLQLRVSQLEGRPVMAAAAAPAAGLGGGAVSGAGGSGVVSAGGSGVGGSTPAGSGSGGSKNKLKVAEASTARGSDGADVFYMAGPVNNYFPNSAKSLTKDNTVYRFKVSANKQDAEFELHTSGAPINEIVQLAESYIKAACDEENLPNYPVKNIVTKKAGQAILEGDKWIIKSKALIRYE